MFARRQPTTLPTVGALLVMAVAIFLGLHQYQAPHVKAQPITPPTLDRIPYPRTLLYGSMTGGGWPYMGTDTPAGTCSNNGSACAYTSDCAGATCNGMTYSQLGDPLNMAAIQAASRYQTIILPPTPMTDVRPDMLAAFRAAGPTNNLFGYVMASYTWCPQDQNGNNSYSVGSYYRDHWLTATGVANCDSQSDSLLWYQNGTRADSLIVNVNIAKPGPNGTFPVADAVAQNIFNHTIGNSAYDGIFIDVFCDRVAWMESGSQIFDYHRAGYGTNNTAQDRTNFDNAWKAAHTRLLSQLRSLVTAAGKPNIPIIANCGPGPTETYPYANGWMREGFPLQNGGTWYSNMYRNVGGYFFESYKYRQPQFNMVFSGLSPYWTPYSATNALKERFTLATGALGEGVGITQESSIAATVNPNHELWYDEYSVNTTQSSLPSFGAAAGAEFSGWLGFPKGDVYQVIAANTNPELVTANSFSSNTTGWNFSASGTAAAVLSLDATTAGEGNSSAKIHITALGVADYSVQIGSSSSLSILANREYSVTFWAKADRLRAIGVTLDHPPGNTYAYHYQPITTAWKRYQVRLKPTSSDVGASFRFDLGMELGDVWFDDIHVQEGITSVYRRDFDRGIVLLNPSDATQAVNLERSFTKILGTVDPVTNNGATVSSVTLLGASSNGLGDAIFLLDLDRVAPGTTGDLRAE